MTEGFKQIEGISYPKPKSNLSEKMNELLSLNRFGKGQDNDEIYDLLKESIQNIKKPIEAELKVAKTKNTQSAQVVSLLFNQILKNIDREVGKELI